MRKESERPKVAPPPAAKEAPDPPDPHTMPFQARLASVLAYARHWGVGLDVVARGTLRGEVSAKLDPVDLFAE